MESHQYIVSCRTDYDKDEFVQDVYSPLPRSVLFLCSPANIRRENVLHTATKPVAVVSAANGLSRRSMIHPSTQLRYIDDRFGYGVFAVQPIPRGTVVWAKDSFDQTFAPSQLDSLARPQRRILEKYGFAIREGVLVLCWDSRRFLNHSCKPNLLMTRYGFEIAVADIQPGDQLACDYGTLNPKRPLSCHCGSAECRGIVHPEDAVLCAGGWSREINESLRSVKSVDQPLWSLIDGEGLLLSLTKEGNVPSDGPKWSIPELLPA